MSVISQNLKRWKKSNSHLFENVIKRLSHFLIKPDKCACHFCHYLPQSQICPIHQFKINVPQISFWSRNCSVKKRGKQYKSHILTIYRMIKVKYLDLIFKILHNLLPNVGLQLTLPQSYAQTLWGSRVHELRIPSFPLFTHT